MGMAHISIKILFLYPSCIFLLLVPESLIFFIVCKQLFVLHVYEAINYFLRFCHFQVPRCILNVYNLLASLQLQRDTAKMHHPGRLLSGFLQLLKFFFILLLILFSSLSWLQCRISCTFSDGLISRFGWPYRWPFGSQSIPMIHVSVSFCSPWRSADQYAVSHLFLLFYSCILSFLPETAAYKWLVDLYNFCGLNFLLHR